MNMLAPIWVSSTYKMLPCYDQYTSTERLHKSLSYLTRLDSDIYCLSEVEESTLPVISQFFGLDWQLSYVSHKNGFWREWLEGKEWVSNGTCILSKRSKLRLLSSTSLDLGDGCRATHVLYSFRGHIISVASIHFDTTDKKWIEAEQLLLQLKKINCDISIIAGDFNFTDVSLFTHLGYVEAATDDQSTPILQGRIDHTLVRGARTNGYVHNLGNACKTVHINGSDHYATIAYIEL